MGAHAVLSPSAAERWLNCTPSARLELTFPNKTSVAAEEGTLAHELAEVMLSRKLNKFNIFQYKNRLKEIQAHKLYEPAMLDFIEDYTGRVLECFSTAQAITPDAQIFLESKLNLTDYIEEGFGTGDVIIIADGVLDIRDLKYGKGVPVSADNNKQMLLYALGALRDFDFLYGIHTVRMTIDQPRLDSVSVWEIQVEELMQWAADELKPKAALAFAGEGTYKPGKHCRFCKASAVCKANAEWNLELAKHDFANAALLTDADISDILLRADIFTKWIKSVEEHALYEAVNNAKQWPGFKLVAGKSNRVYSDTKAVATKLLANGINSEVIYKPIELVGITEMTKAIGKSLFDDLLSPLIVKPPGKPTLVPESDKRPAYNSAEGAKADFLNN